jgi:hypothetical protein
MDGARNGLRATILVALMLSSALVALVAPGHLVTDDAEAALNPVPVLTLSLTPTQLQSRVTNSQNGPVMFGGNATVEKFSGNVERVTVTLSASCIWPAIVSPSTMVFTQSGRSQPFYVTVVVPPKTSSLEVGTLIVSGTAKAPGMPVVTATANAVVTVAQYFKLSIGADTPLREVKPGDITYNTINIYNEGNGLDSFEIEISNQKDLLKKEFNVIIERTSIDIKQDEYSQVKITIQTPQGFDLWARDLILVSVKVHSAEARNVNILYSQDYSLSIFMRGFHLPGFDPFLVVVAMAFMVVAMRRGREVAIRRRLR